MSDKIKLSHYTKTIITFMIISLLLILSFNCYNYYQITKNPPSDMWSKETTIGIANSDNIPKIIKEDDRILVAYQGTNDFVISVCDISGNKISDSHYSYNSSYINNLMFFKKGSSYFLTYNYDNVESGNLEAIELNSQMDEINRSQYTDVKQCFQINSRYIIFYHSGIMSCYDLIEDTETSTSVENSSYIAAAQCGNSVFITYFNFSSVEGLIMKDGVFSDIMDLAPHIYSTGITYSDLTISGDSDNCYILYTKYRHQEPIGSKCIVYDFNTNSFKENPFSHEEVSNIRGCYSSTNARFYGSMERELINRHFQSDLVSFTLNNNQMEDITLATRQRSNDLNEYGDDEYLVYLDYNNGSYRVNITSTNNKFINANSGFKKIDIINAISYTLETIFTGFAYTLVIGSCWVIPSVCAASIGSMLIYKLKDKYRNLLFVTIPIITLCLKYYMITAITYYGCSNGYCTIITKPSSILLISALYLVITNMVHYINFNNRKDHFLVTKISIPIILDCIISCILFMPIMP